MSPCQSNNLAILGQSVDLKNMFEIIAITEQNHRLKRIYAKMSMQNARLQKALGKQR